MEFAIVAWSIGALLVLTRFLLGTAAVWRDTLRAAQPCNPKWLVQAGFIQEELGMQRDASLLCGTKLSVPYAWGLLRPVVCLPAEAATWSEERLRMVLLHELSHVQRWDALTELLAQIALIVFWFNPFLWVAVRQMRIEREHACDDRVLNGGVKPSNYVEELLEMIRKIGEGGNAPAFAAIAMARRTQFESRMLAVLNPKIDHGIPSRRAIGAVAAVALLFAVTLSCVRPAVAADRVVAVKPAADAESPTLIGTFGGDSITPAQTGFEEAIDDCEAHPRKRERHYCEVRDVPFTVKDSHVDFDDDYVSGVIFTTSRDKRTAVRALIRTDAPTLDEAREIASRVKLTDGGVLRPSTPGENRNSWSVLYEVTIPEGVSVRARTENGRIALSWFRGSANIKAVNGPLQLNNVEGDISGGTQNGPIYVELSGRKWEGAGLDLQSQNGPIDLSIPDDYSAHLVTGTINGPMDMLRSMNIKRLNSKRITADIGEGGTTVRVTTDNGPATIH